jgi:hypothetical protein
MKIWIKLNDSWGYVGVSQHSVDNNMSENDISAFLCENASEKIREINNTNYLTTELIEFMSNIGWTEDMDSFVSNGDVHAFAFTSLKDL